MSQEQPPPGPPHEAMRHGFDEEYSSEHFLSLLANSFYIYFDDKRHNTSGNPVPDEYKQLPEHYKTFQPIEDWKMMKERQKTVSAVLVLCLNLGVAPPDVMKTHPCAKYEAWCDPLLFPDTKKAVETIGKNLQAQYETLSLRTRYKQSLDPCVEDVKRFCNTLRRNAKDERILFHFNGHGVPHPTSSGEIWVFNRGYTQYIPISLYDLQTWLGAPVVFVYDCNSAGNIVHNYKKFVQKRIDDDNEGNHDTSAPSPTSAFLDTIQLAACKSNEVLPMSPDLPADLFTCCLTCPLDISIKWFIMQSPLKKNYYLLLPRNLVGNVIIPGKLTDRRTPLGELNWIFTAITDTIAWTSLSRPIFKRLFRQDLMVATLFRNFLLAKRIMPHLSCNPISDPPLPDSVRHHPMWDSWDLAIDQVCAQLIHDDPAHKHRPVAADPIAPAGSYSGSDPVNLPNYQHLTFFEQQLTAFEIWLKFEGPSTKEAPEQLPIVLQVLLSQVHRLRALALLARFLDLGPWAAYLALSVGIFPYVLKLLQSPAQELRPVLIFIWARIMAIDNKSMQQELCKDKGYNYFYVHLNAGAPGGGANMAGNGAGNANGSAGGTSNGTSATAGAPATPNQPTVLMTEDHKAMCAFILTLFIKDFKNGQRLAFSAELIGNCLRYVLASENPLLRQWCCLLLAHLWVGYGDGKWIAFKDGYLSRLLTMVNDPIPEVRTAVVYALTAFLGDSETPSLPGSMSDVRHDELKQQDLRLATTVLGLMGDGLPMVRKEIVFFMGKFITSYQKFFLVVSFGQLEEEVILLDSPNELNDLRKRSPAYGLIFLSVWKALLILTEDPHPEVKQHAETLVDQTMLLLNRSELGPAAREMEAYLLGKSALMGVRTVQIGEDRSRGERGEKGNTGYKLQNGALRPPNSHSPTLMSKATQNNQGTAQISQITTKNTPPSPRKEMPRSASLHLQNRTPNVLSVRLVSAATEPSKPSSRLSGFSLSKLFHTLRFAEDTDLKGFSRMLSSTPPSSYETELRPQSARFRPRDLLEEPVLAADSGFFQYSCEYFTEPQMSRSDMDEPGLEEYVQRLWRRNRNEAIIQETQPQKSLAVRGDWNRNVRTMNNKNQPRLLRFTQFEKLLVACNDKDTVLVWDWEQMQPVRKFSNGNPFGTKITDIRFLNEDDHPLVLVGLLDGVVKIYKNFQFEHQQPELVAGWRALTDLLLTPRTTGIVADWQQSRGALLVSGDVKVIRVWDAPRELCVADIPARSTSAITSLTSDQVVGNTIVAGFDDGSVRVYDRRMDARELMVRVWNPARAQQSGGSAKRRIGRGSIRNTRMQRGGLRELVTGSSDGFVNLWDIRLAEPVLTFTNEPDKSMACLDVHEHAPVVTTGAKAVSVWTTGGELVSTLRNPHESLLTNRTASYLTGVAFHPHRMMMATTYNQDGHINVYTCTDVMREY